MKIIFKIFKKISDFFIFPKSYLHHIKYRNSVLFFGDEIFCEQSVVRDNSINLILISEACQKWNNIGILSLYRL